MKKLRLWGASATTVVVSTIWLLELIFVLVAVPRHVLALDTCPPGRAAAGNPIAVPGKPGEKGWLLDNKEKDKALNRIQVWCLQARPGVHGGPDYAVLWIPAGKPGAANDANAVWIGGCFFPRGQNGGPFKPGTIDTGNKGMPDEFVTINWLNVNPANGKNWDFRFKPKPPPGTLTVNQTQTGFVLKQNPVTKQWYLAPAIIILGTDSYPAPKEFKDLHFKTDMFAVTDAGPGGRAAEAFVASGTVSNEGLWSYSLSVNPIGGSGTPDDPFVGSPVELEPGDTFTIAAAGVQAPFVSGLAAQPEFGGWKVSQFDDEFISFTATSGTTLSPGTVITGFGFASTFPGGTVPWDVSSKDVSVEEYAVRVTAGSSGLVNGPEKKLSQIDEAVGHVGRVALDKGEGVIRTYLINTNHTK